MDAFDARPPRGAHAPPDGQPRQPSPHDPLERLLAPLEPATFFQEVWERRHHVLQRGAPGHYARLLALDDVDALIGLSGIVAPLQGDIRLVKNADDGLAVRPARDQAIANLHDVYSAYAQGFSVVVNQVERHWAPVAALCRGLETVFQCRVRANLYLTPREAQGFAPHYDTHDVFVLQLAGAKAWRLYGAATPLPLQGPADERPVPPELLGTPTEECRLAAGDLLYLPRGHVHEALTTRESSLHLTVGLHVTRWADLVCTAIMRTAERDVALREAVPPDWLRGEATAAPVHTRLQQLLGLVASEVSTESVLAHQTRRFLAERPPALEGHFRSLDRLPDLTPDTRVRRRAGLSCTVVVENGAAALHFGGNWVAGPERLAPQLHFVAATEAFTVAELPGRLNDSGKVVLVRRLVREGLLRVEPPEGEAPAESGRG